MPIAKITGAQAGATRLPAGFGPLVKVPGGSRLVGPGNYLDGPTQDKLWTEATAKGLAKAKAGIAKAAGQIRAADARAKRAADEAQHSTEEDLGLRTKLTALGYAGILGIGVSLWLLKPWRRLQHR